MIKLSKGQAAVLAVASLPMAAVGVAGAVATYVNMNHVLHRGASALGLVAAGEGATLICALVALAVTLMGQHTPATVRAGMWLVPLAASAVGVALAPTGSEAVVMAFTPLAMTAAGEGVAFVARRVVAYRTGTDIEQQRRSGLLLWHANRAANGGGVGRRISTLAVWRLTRKFAETDTQLSVQLGEIQRFRISQGADENLAAVFVGTMRTGKGSGLVKALEGTSAARSALPESFGGEGGYRAINGASTASDADIMRHEAIARMAVGMDVPPEILGPLEDEMAETLAQAERTIEADPEVKLLTTTEVAALKGVRDGTVRSWAHRHPERFPRKQMIDGVAMYHPLDIAALD